MILSIAEYRPHPLRIQRKRTKGWRILEGAVNCARPSRWGNPYRPEEFAKPKQCLEAYRLLIETDPETIVEIQTELRDEQLACWCRLEKPCHVDILCEIANREPGEQNNQI